MKTYIINLFLLPALIAGLGLIPAGRVTAQTFTNLHSFAGSSDGANPYAGLILSGNTLYGTTSQSFNRSSGDKGTVFAVNTDGTGFTNLHNFTGGSDGYNPYAGLILSGNTLYGTARYGGSSGGGTVFALNTDGTGFTTLYSFAGARPYGGLILSVNTLYGTAYYGGSSGAGAVFAVSTNGTGFTNLYSFTAAADNGNGYHTNSDGANPYAGLILSGNTLYGTALDGGSSGNGTVFAVNTDGTGFTNLHTFTGGSDGSSPYGRLILSGSMLYGTASYSVSPGGGTVFALNTDGTGFTILHTFSSYSDGASPDAGVMLSGSTLYGTAFSGGSANSGTVFALNTNGTGFTTLHNFTVASGSPYTNSDGIFPESVLILTNNTLYGTTFSGGTAGRGTVFSISLPPLLLTIIPYGGNVILTWPADAAGFTLQSTTNLVAPAVWSTVSPGPVVIGGQNEVINPITGTQKFYRLIQ